MDSLTSSPVHAVLALSPSENSVRNRWELPGNAVLRAPSPEAVHGGGSRWFTVRLRAPVRVAAASGLQRPLRSRGAGRVPGELHRAGPRGVRAGVHDELAAGVRGGAERGFRRHSPRPGPVVRSRRPAFRGGLPSASGWASRRLPGGPAVCFRIGSPTGPPGGRPRRAPEVPLRRRGPVAGSGRGCPAPRVAGSPGASSGPPGRRRGRGRNEKRPPANRGPLVVRCAPEGIRTPNLLIRSQMLYPLSYGRVRRTAVRR